MDLIKEDDSIPEDYQKKMLDDMQKITDEATKKIDEVVQEKDKEIMAI